MTNVASPKDSDRAHLCDSRTWAPSPRSGVIGPGDAHLLAAKTAPYGWLRGSLTLDDRHASGDSSEEAAVDGGVGVERDGVQPPAPRPAEQDLLR